jgi:hypothetical protein
MFAVNIDRKTSTLLVCDWSNGTAFLFQIWTVFNKITRLCFPSCEITITCFDLLHAAYTNPCLSIDNPRMPGIYPCLLDRIALFAKHIYNADYQQGTLSCYRGNGDLLWSSKQGYMPGIRGLSIDRHYLWLAHFVNGKLFTKREGPSLVKIFTKMF